jgi:hypothetical protein
VKGLAALFATACFLAGCGGSGSSDKSSQIAAALGSSSSCTDTGYGIISKVDNSKTTIYDCYDGDKAKRMCVTQENGITRDATETVRFLFQGTLAGGKPSCLNG